MTLKPPSRHQAGSAVVTVLSILVFGTILGVLLLLLFGNRNNGADTVSKVIPGTPGTTLSQPSQSEASSESGERVTSQNTTSTAATPKEGEAASGSPGESAQSAPEKTLEQTVANTDFKGTGAEIYVQACQSCHMAGGKGAQGAGIYPPLAGNPKVNSAPYVESMVLFGHGGMPGFGHYMDDEQVSAIVNYIRTELNKNTDKVAPADIKKLRPADPHYMIFGEAAG